VNCNNNAIITWSVACKFDFYLSSAVNERAAANVNSLGSQLCNRGFYSRLLLSYGIAFFTPALDKERAVQPAFESAYIYYFLLGIKCRPSTLLYLFDLREEMCPNGR
jgi:hypothetical protein